MRELNPFEWAVLPFKKFAVFSGRAPRAEYWWFYLATLVGNFVTKGLDRALGTDFLDAIFSLIILLPWLAVTVRRLHDTDRTGWWLLAFMSTFAIMGVMVVFMAAERASGFSYMVAAILAGLFAAITMLVFMVQEGTDGENRFGPDPYGPNNLEQVFA